MFGLSLEKITLAIQGDLAYAGEGVEFTGACVDLHKVKEGTLLFLLESVLSDQKREMLRELGQKKVRGVGVVTSLQSSALQDLGFSGPLIKVENPLKALQQLAVAQRNLFTGPVIILTGNAGKKAAQELLLTLLQKKGSVLCYEETTEPEWGLPLKLLQLQREDSAFLVVMGAYELQSSDFLYRLCQPSYGVITEFCEETQTDLFAHLPAKGALALAVTDKKALRPWLSNIRSSLSWFGSVCPKEEDEADKAAKGHLAALALSKHLGL